MVSKHDRGKETYVQDILMGRRTLCERTDANKKGPGKQIFYLQLSSKFHKNVYTIFVSILYACYVWILIYMSLTFYLCVVYLNVSITYYAHMSICT